MFKASCELSKIYTVVIDQFVGKMNTVEVLTKVNGRKMRVKQCKEARKRERERERKRDHQWMRKRQSERQAKQEIGRFRLVSAPSVGSLGQIFGYMGVEQYSIQDCTRSQCKLQLFAARGRLVIRCTTIFRNIPTAPSAENPERPTTRPGRDRIKYE